MLEIFSGFEPGVNLLRTAVVCSALDTHISSQFSQRVHYKASRCFSDLKTAPRSNITVQLQFIFPAFKCPSDVLTFELGVRPLQASSILKKYNSTAIVDCQWMTLCYENFTATKVTIKLYNFSDNIKPSAHDFIGITEGDTGQKHQLNMSVLSTNKMVFESSSRILLFHIQVNNSLPEFSIRFDYFFTKDIFPRQLPHVKISQTSGYINLPTFNYNYSQFLKYIWIESIRYTSRFYIGFFELNAGFNKSVFLAFAQFQLTPETSEYIDEFIEFEADASNVKWKKSGYQKIKSGIYHSPIKITYYLNGAYRISKFKMIYAILRRSEEPQLVSDGLYNCSVPHFDAFRPVLACNMLEECAGGEDEQGCSFHTKDCGPGMADVGTKCYRLFKNSKRFNWYEAKAQCEMYDMSLPMQASPEDQTYLFQTVQHIHHFVGVFIGAIEIDFLQSRYELSLYNRHLWKWVDGRMAFYLQPTALEWLTSQPACLYIISVHNITDLSTRNMYQTISTVACNDKIALENVLCEREKITMRMQSVRLNKIIFNITNVHVNKGYYLCSDGHLTKPFFQCDVQSKCGTKEPKDSCPIETSDVTVAMFKCSDGRTYVHFTGVCDHVRHCWDNSDEDFCQFPPCPKSMFKCRNEQCISPYKYNNNAFDCYDLTDEPNIKVRRNRRQAYQPSVIYLNITGLHVFEPAVLKVCPDTHFWCPAGDCLPVYLRCNNVYDCTGREDEADCETYTCPGFYRCWGSKVCLHPKHVCDGFRQCPFMDDEQLCGLERCPDVCHCQGHAFVCSARFHTSSYPELRYLDAGGSNLTLQDFDYEYFLIYLRLASCHIEKVIAACVCPNLRHLDLSWNNLAHLDMNIFQYLLNLQVLIISNNPLSIVINSNDLKVKSLNVHLIDLSNTSIELLNGSALRSFSFLRSLNISNSRVDTITEQGFKATSMLESFDARDSPLKSFPSDLVKDLTHLTTVHTSNYKLCCPVMLPTHFKVKNCHTQVDLLSSCDDLLKSNSFRASLWIFAVMAILGNVGSVVGRVYLNMVREQSGFNSFSVFITSLSLSDCLMGIYLIVIGTHDLLYRGEYVFHDDGWKTSFTCRLAGVLSFVSNEVSTFMIFLVTLDRFLTIRSPLSQIQFRKNSACVACAAVWVLGILLAIIPLLPDTSHWQFYSQTSICIPLPFTKGHRFPGYLFSFSVMTIFNFVLFLLTALGQIVIYWSFKNNSVDSSKQDLSSRKSTLARRLSVVVVSDFLCWFPVGLLSVMSAAGLSIPDEANVAMATFVLPLRSAFNPFLYTLNVLRERHRKLNVDRLLKQLESQIAIDYLKQWFVDGILLKTDVSQFL